MATTTIQPLPYPLPGDPADGPAQIKALAEAVETRVVMRFPSIAARDAALPSGKLADGMVCHIAAESAVYVRAGGAWRLLWQDTGWVTLLSGTLSVVACRTGMTVTVQVDLLDWVDTGSNDVVNINDGWAILPPDMRPAVELYGSGAGNQPGVGYQVLGLSVRPGGSLAVVKPREVTSDIAASATYLVG